MTAVISGTLCPVPWAMPAAMGTRATTVPTLVPIDNEMKHEATKRPGSNMLAGNTEMARLTVESMAPMPLADAAKAPAST